MGLTFDITSLPVPIHLILGQEARVLFGVGWFNCAESQVLSDTFHAAAGRSISMAILYADAWLLGTQHPDRPLRRQWSAALRYLTLECQPSSCRCGFADMKPGGGQGSAFLGSTHVSCMLQAMDHAGEQVSRAQVIIEAFPATKEPSLGHCTFASSDSSSETWDYSRRPFNSSSLQASLSLNDQAGEQEYPAVPPIAKAPQCIPEGAACVRTTSQPMPHSGCVS